MIRNVSLMLATGLALAGCSTTETERRGFAVLESDGRFELREYEPAVVAETVVEGDFVESGNDAFRILFRYIAGDNAAEQEISMTAPVTQEAEGVAHRFTFLMPSDFDMSSLPAPEDPRITLREEPAGRFASVQYSGFWNLENYERALADLRDWMSKQGIEANGSPVWARYDPPFMPWFLRTNEILIPVGSVGS